MGLPTHAELVKEVRENGRTLETLLEEFNTLLGKVSVLAQTMSDADLPINTEDFGPDSEYCNDCGSLLVAGHFDSCPSYVAPIEPVTVAASADAVNLPAE